MLIKAVGLIDGDLDDVEDVGGFLEDHVHFLQRAQASLREEEVGHGEDEGVDYRED